MSENLDLKEVYCDHGQVTKHLTPWKAVLCSGSQNIKYVNMRTKVLPIERKGLIDVPDNPIP